MEQLTLNLTIDEINLILDALSQMFYVKVHRIIDKVQTQSELQIQSR